MIKYGQRTCSSMDRAVVFGTKGCGFDPRQVHLLEEDSHKKGEGDDAQSGTDGHQLAGFEGIATVFFGE